MTLSCPPLRMRAGEQEQKGLKVPSMVLPCPYFSGFGFIDLKCRIGYGTSSRYDKKLKMLPMALSDLSQWEQQKGFSPV